MIDKQIIDEMIERIGFDVQQCGYLKITKDALNYPEIGGTYTAFECNLYSRDCDFIERCRYKQLLRKEQELEELQETIDDFITDNSSLYCYDGKQPSNLDELQECMQSSLNEFVKYKQSLDEIEKYIKQTGYYIPYGAKEDIQNIINKAKEEEEE